MATMITVIITISIIHIIMFGNCHSHGPSCNDYSVVILILVFLLLAILFLFLVFLS